MPMNQSMKNPEELRLFVPDDAPHMLIREDWP